MYRAPRQEWFPVMSNNGGSLPQHGLGRERPGAMTIVRASSFSYITHFSYGGNAGGLRAICTALALLISGVADSWLREGGNTFLLKSFILSELLMLP